MPPQIGMQVYFTNNPATDLTFEPWATVSAIGEVDGLLTLETHLADGSGTPQTIRDVTFIEYYDERPTDRPWCNPMKPPEPPPRAADAEPIEEPNN